MDNNIHVLGAKIIMQNLQMDFMFCRICFDDYHLCAVFLSNEHVSVLYPIEWEDILIPRSSKDHICYLDLLSPPFPATIIWMG